MVMTEETLRHGIKARQFGRKVYTFETIDSTNNCAKALAGCFAQEGTVVFAEHQSAGRGRLGRAWEANPNENLMFSVILRPSLSPDAVNLLPLYAAVAVAAAVEKTTGLRVQCKWPNDLLIDGKKFAGILLEGSLKQSSVEYVVIGIGINVNQMGFPPALAQKATSLRMSLGQEIDRPVLFREIMNSMEQYHTTLAPSKFSAVVPLWTTRTQMLNRHISIDQQGSVLSGVVRGISPEGGLVVALPDREQTVFAGDVTILES
jgi:BirA family transcriptional regulator, biotin operon repressor / biotin---[acetyl-CoA-carboxylase] ligase